MRLFAKKIFKWQWYVLLLPFVLVALRGPIFRACVRYECREIISVPAIGNDMLRAEIQQAAEALPEGGIEALIDFAQSFTASQLKFRASAADVTPDGVRQRREAHCVGYAALMAAVLQLLIEHKSEELITSPTIEQCRGDIYFLGLRLTGPDRPAFFRDHDYVQVRYSSPGMVESYDPSVYDYLWIRRVD